MIYRGIVRRTVVELEDKVVLPEGTEVEVVVREPHGDKSAAAAYPKGSPQALLAAFDTPPRCTAGDVEVLIKAIEQGGAAAPWLNR
jgi:hypothetical protein